MDYKLQEKMNEISGCDAQNMSVSPVVQIEDRGTGNSRKKSGAEI